MAAKKPKIKYTSGEEVEIVDLRPRPRYVMDYKAPPIEVPVPTQICFFLGDHTVLRNASTVRLVEITDVQYELRENTFHYTIYATVLSTKDGHPTAKRHTFIRETGGNMKYRKSLYIPDFVAAIDRWETVPDPRPAYADVLDVFEHGFGLVNAKYLDLKQEMTILTATLSRLASNQNELVSMLHKLTLSHQKDDPAAIEDQLTVSHKNDSPTENQSEAPNS